MDSGEIKNFVSGREAAKFIGMNQSGLAKYISKQNFYLGRGFLVYKSDHSYEEIIKSEAYQKTLIKYLSKSDTETDSKD